MHILMDMVAIENTIIGHYIIASKGDLRLTLTAGSIRACCFVVQNSQIFSYW